MALPREPLPTMTLSRRPLPTTAYGTYALAYDMNILSLRTITLSLKSGPLFESVDLDIDERDRFGLLGRNGSGKSSFLRLLAGILDSEAGSLEAFRPLALSYLPQSAGFGPDETVRSFIYGGFSTEIAARLQRHEVEDEEAAAPYASAARGGIASGTTMAASVHADRLYRGGSATLENPVSLENRYRALLRELGIRDVDAPLGRLSGGERRKVALARALAPRADILLLDEPTNHLDLDSIEWLEDRLASFQGALVLVTHDRWFLDSVADSILEIADRRIRRHPGAYTEFIQRRAERLSALAKAENRRLATLKIEMAWLMRGARARATKSERRKRDIEAMSETLLPPQERKIAFSSAETRLGKKACIFDHVSLRYGDLPIIGDLSYELVPGARVGVAGPNGSGKTSLLRLIEGTQKPDSGTVELGSTVRLSHFHQTADKLPVESTILEYIQEHAERFSLPGMPEIDAQQLLERFGFDRDFMAQKLSSLSGGELRRLMLVRILAESPNLLLLDEPTNDLDIETIEALEEYLEEFRGTLVVVSHDRLLLDKLAVELLAFSGPGRVEKFRGSYLEWRESRTDSKAGSGAPTASAPWSSLAPGTPASGTESSVATSGLSGPKRAKGLSFKERKEMDSLLEAIGSLEAEKEKLESFFQNPGPDTVLFATANLRYRELASRIEEAMARWEDLASRDLS